MKVLKFGGSSVGSPLGRKNIREIALSISEQTIIVVSALGGITDMLILVAKEASYGDIEGYTNTFEAIRQRHLEAINLSVLPELQEQTKENCEALLIELSNILKGVSLINDLSPKTEAAIVAYGERLNSIIIASTIEDTEHIDSREIIKTYPYFNRHIIDFTLTSQLIRSKIGESKAHTIVMGGFISSDKSSGQTTNLGRGGSDYTAAILASALGASELFIYTDVDGFMSADPRIIKEAELIDHLTFVEAMELCNFGAKVIYPPTIFPAYNADIPIIIRNTFNLECKGTYISIKKGQSAQKSSNNTIHKAVKGVSSINDTALLTINGLGRVGVIGINYRIFKALGKAGISLFLVSQNSSEGSTSIAMKNSDAQKAAEVLSGEFAQEIAMGDIDECIIKKNLATIAVVGEKLKQSRGITQQLYSTLSQNGINIIASAEGASQSNISFVTDLSSLRKAIEVLHNLFFKISQQELNIYIVGVGGVGENLIELITERQSQLQEQEGVKLNVVGISELDPNTLSRSIIKRSCVDLPNYKAELSSKDSFCYTAKEIAEIALKQHLHNSVVVDCTPTNQLSKQYDRLLGSNINIVGSNKIAASSDYEHFTELKQIAKSNNVKFLYNTNVGAGLPIIKTINALRESGDTITKVEALLSGSINSILCSLFSEVSLSEAVKIAIKEGLTESDIRIDMSGTDVARKLVILARECGYKINIGEIALEPFIPNELLDANNELVIENLQSLDSEWRKRVEAAKLKGKELRYVARMSVLDEEEQSVRCTIGVEEVSFNNALHSVEGGDNIVLIHSHRYREFPLQIKGYGAGTKATAEALYADIVSLKS